MHFLYYFCALHCICLSAKVDERGLKYSYPLGIFLATCTLGSIGDTLCNRILSFVQKLLRKKLYSKRVRAFFVMKGSGSVNANFTHAYSPTPNLLSFIYNSDWGYKRVDLSDLSICLKFYVLYHIKPTYDFY